MATHFVYGPPGCGKTRNGYLLKRALGCSTMVDGWSPGEKVVRGALHLTNASIEALADYASQGTVMHYNTAARKAGVR